jgi:hypothetical protein
MATTYEKIATSTLGSAAASITFSSIPSTYTDLSVILTTRGASGSVLRLRFNSDTGTNYSRTNLIGNGTTASSTRSTTSNNISIGFGITTSGIWGLYTINIFSYAGSTYKTCLVTASEDENGSGSVTSRVGLWQNTAAITTIDLSATSGTLDAGTTATLYGILKA